MGLDKGPCLRKLHISRTRCGAPTCKGTIPRPLLKLLYLAADQGKYIPAFVVSILRHIRGLLFEAHQVGVADNAV